MIIGIDLRALQTGHKFRGIGEVAKQTTNRILERAALEATPPSFIFYEYEDDDPKDLLSIPKNLTYTVIKLGPMPETNPARSRQQKLKSAFNNLYGKPIKDSRMSDVFLQFDYAFGVPKDTRTVLVKHDLIPIVFWSRFFESAWVPLRRRALRTTLRTLYANYRYRRILRRGVNDAGLIVTVSDSTKRDLQRLLGVDEGKINTVHLGVDRKPAKTSANDKDIELPVKPYLLFVGAGDERRRVDDLVAAYNNLKASGVDIQLVLVGENFKQPENIPVKSVRDAVIGSSYAKDILTMGYVSDATKQQLYKEALAYVYPTKYEGFGIPVLEAMLQECSIITYKNSSIPEVGGKHALYATDWQDIVKKVKWLLNEPSQEKKKRLELARKHAEQFTWDKTAQSIYIELLKEN
jgi:glycosyltransferase involved in cell wall biosynthesis